MNHSAYVFGALLALCTASHAQTGDDAIGSADVSQYAVERYDFDERCIMAVVERCTVLPLQLVARPSLKKVPLVDRLRRTALMREFQKVGPGATCSSPQGWNVAISESQQMTMVQQALTGTVYMIPSDDGKDPACFGFGGGSEPMDWSGMKAARYPLCRQMAEAVAWEMGCIRNTDLRATQLQTTLNKDMKALLSQFCKTYAEDPTKCEQISP